MLWTAQHTHRKSYRGTLWVPFAMNHPPNKEHHVSNSTSHKPCMPAAAHCLSISRMLMRLDKRRGWRVAPPPFKMHYPWDETPAGQHLTERGRQHRQHESMRRCHYPDVNATEPLECWQSDTLTTTMKTNMTQQEVNIADICATVAGTCPKTLKNILLICIC